MAKSKARAAAQPPRAARVARRNDAERWSTILVVGGVVAVILLVVGIIAFGWYQTHVKPLNKVILQVGTMEYDLGKLERYMRSYQAENAGLLQGQQLAALPNIVLDQLESDATVLQAAGKLSITVTEEEVDAKVRELGGLAEDSDPSLFAQQFRQQVKASKLKPDEFREKLKAQLLQDKVRNYFVFLAPATEAQVHGRWIVLDDEAKANATLARLNAGEDFAAVATETTLDTSTKDKGGDVGWLLSQVGSTPEEIDTFLFDGKPGDRSDVITSSSNYYIVEILERDDNRAIDDTQKQQVGAREMAKWVSTERNALSYTRDLSTEDQARALKDVI